MVLMTRLVDDLKQVEVIVVGANGLAKGGCTGCIIASRLSDADPSLSVLVIESGTNSKDLPAIDHVGFWFSHILRSMELPALLEKYNGPGPNDKHGYEGHIQVSRSRLRNLRSEYDFLDALSKAGWPEIEDIDCFGPTNGAMRTMRYLDPDGRRQDTANAYLRPRLEDGKHPRLHALLESQVERVVFENKTAVGVTYRPNPSYHHDAGLDAQRKIMARKLVIITCGPMFSPLVLERSGVGDPKVLGRAGVPVVADVPGVGADYEDHQSMMYPCKSSLRPEETLDGIHSNRDDPTELVASKSDMLSYNALDIQAKLRPTDADVASLDPDFQAAWDKHFKQVPDKPLMMISPVATFPGDPSAFPSAAQYFTLVAFSLYPLSRGHLHITGPKLDDNVDFDAGLLSDSKDLDVRNHVWMYKKQREVASNMKLSEGAVPGTQPTFPPGNKANDGSANIEHSEEDDRIIERWIREHVDSTWHPIATCKMAARDKLGVVDPALNVHGVRRLKVADLSIAPHNIGANTAKNAMTIAEKAADMLIEELVFCGDDHKQSTGDA
ncbi:hypothetical protein F4780DRAFT_768195 [Xylariomycetidae sp. FL0641]|nr:hypothetical protein F4780DRAFT_768195 [Xylariomycetidae sp. FL0641]